MDPMVKPTGVRFKQELLYANRFRRLFQSPPWRGRCLRKETEGGLNLSAYKTFSEFEEPLRAPLSGSRTSPPPGGDWNTRQSFYFGICSCLIGHP
jgi:hypothetical protein